MKPQPARITSLSPPQATLIREKPKMGCDYNFGITKDDINDYQKDLKDYQLSQVPMDIENAQKGTLMNTSGGEDWKGWFVDRGGWYAKLELNQPVQIVRTEKDKCRIVKSN